MDGQNISAYQYSAGDWSYLKQTYKKASMRMHCCNSEAVPCTSPRGTFYFRHKAKGSCRSRPESAEHLELKSLIAKAAIAAGWNAVTEWFGHTPNGDAWEADVFCQRGESTVIFEIQTSYQTKDELQRRSSKYREAKIPFFWLASAKTHKPEYAFSSEFIPFFLFSTSQDQEEPKIGMFNIAISAFVHGVLSRRIRWVKDESMLRYEILYYEDGCEACKERVRIVYGLRLGGNATFSIESDPQALAMVMLRLKPEELVALGLCILVRRGEPPREQFFNVCPICKISQNNRLVLSRLNSPQFRSSGSFGVATYESRRQNGPGGWQHSEV